MSHYVGLDAAKATTHICILDRNGAVVARDQVETSPKAIIASLRGQGRRYARVGMESWGMANWIYEGLARAGLPIICINAVHAHAYLKAQRNKTDRNDAAGIARLMFTGSYRVVHIKSRASQEIRAALTARQALSERLIGLQNTIRGILAGFGHKLPTGRKTSFVAHVEAATRGDSYLKSLVATLLAVRSSLCEQLQVLERRLAAMAADDPVCRRLMTAPGVGPIVSLEFRSAIDEPGRFPNSRLVGVHLGLTPRTHQSGPLSSSGGISRWGPTTVRRALYLAARSLCGVRSRPCWLTDWGNALAIRKGYKKAMVAVARKLAVILHRMWVSETDFAWSRPNAMGASQ